MRHQQDIRGGTLANMRHQRINKVHCATQTLSGEASSPITINRRQKKNENIFTSVRSSRRCIALSRICNGRFCCLHLQLCKMFERTTQLALQQQLITQLNLGISSSSSSMMFQNGIMTTDAGPWHHVLMHSTLLVTDKNDNEVRRVCISTSVILLTMTTAVSYTVEWRFLMLLSFSFSCNLSRSGSNLLCSHDYRCDHEGEELLGFQDNLWQTLAMCFSH